MGIVTKITLGSGLSAALLCACLGPDPAPAAKQEWGGLARRTCGPADGPAMEFLIDTLPLSCDSSRSAAFRYYAGNFAFDPQYSGFSFISQPSVACDGNSDPVSETVRLDLSAWDSTALTAHFRRIRTHPCRPEATAPDTLEATARLKRCPEAPGPMCG
jgi:hypothetical protein